MHIFSAIRYSEWSMRRKLFGYMFLLVLILLLALVCGFVLFGRFDSAGQNTYDSLDIQMENFEKDISTHFERLAAASIELSEDTTALIEERLTQKGLSFHDLNDSEGEITAIQEAMLEPLHQRLLRENCSGVFVMLDATVNSAVVDAHVSRTGLYLQQSSYKTPNKSVLLYRGLSETGKRHGVFPHRKWRLEFRTDLFPNYDEITANAGLPLGQAYFLTDRFTLPGTSEDAVLMVAPIWGTDGTFYGLCGYEVSASFFLTYHAQPTRILHLTCLLAERQGQSLDASAGLSCGVSSGYYLRPKGVLSIAEVKNGLLTFFSDETSYIGVAREISMSPNNKPFTMAAMIPKSDYDRAVITVVVQNIILWALILFFAVSCCLLFSRRYLSPILKGLEQIKSDNRTQAKSSVPEINDLFVFLAEQDRQYEESLNALAQQNQTVQSEIFHLQTKYEQAQQIYEKAQSEFVKAQENLAAAKQEIDRLSYSRKKEIDPDDYQNFLNGIRDLTPTERNIFNWYLEGKTAKEILGLAGILQGTLKFHNHNILQKLGVPSRKQMLRFAALMKQQEQGGNAK